MPPLKIALLLALVAGFLFQVPAVSAKRHHDSEPDEIGEDDSLDENDDRAYQVKFVSEDLEKMITWEQNALKNVQPRLLGAEQTVIFHMQIAHRIYNAMKKRVLMAREFVEMAIRDNFWDAVTKRFKVQRKKIDRRIRKCHQHKDESALSVFVMEMKNRAKLCGDEIIDRAEVNKQEFEMVARRMNDIYWEVQGCLGKKLKLTRIALKHERKRRGIFSALAKGGKKFIQYALPEVAGMAAEYAMDQIPSPGGGSGGGEGGRNPKLCIDREILNNTIIYTQMILYRSYDAIVLVQDAFASKSLKKCVTNVVEKQSKEEFKELMENCYCSREEQSSPRKIRL